MNRYEEYFNTQVGSGYGGGGTRSGGGVGRIYIGSPYQKGHGGIGSFLAGIFRRVLPLFTRGAKAVGKEAVRAGLNIMSDVTAHDVPLRESFRNRVRESGESLKRKAEERMDKLMEGSGYKRPRYVDPLQLLGGSVGLASHRKSSSRKRKSTSRRKSGDKKKKKKNSTTSGKKKKKKKKKKGTTKRKVKRTVRDIFD